MSNLHTGLVHFNMTINLFKIYSHSDKSPFKLWKFFI